MKVLIFLALLITSCYSAANLVVIEPDDFAGGTNLSEVSQYVTLTSFSGDPVFSSTIHHRDYLAADGNDSSILGDRVFSLYGDRNSEWYYWPERPSNPGFSGDVENAMMLSFSQPVDYFSVVFAELFPDAGCCVSDPIVVDMFDLEGELIESVYADDNPSTYLGELDAGGEKYEAWPVWEFSSFFEGVSTVLIGGESEPTTIDRLSFNVPQQVPESSSLMLLLLSLLLLLFARHKVL